MGLLRVQEQIAYCTLLVIIIVFGLLGNVAVCVAIYKDSHLRQQIPNALIFNLGITDLLTVVLVVPFCVAAILQGEWLFGEFWCQTTAFLYYTFAIVSLESLAFISLDRFYAIVRPLKYRSVITSKKVTVVIVFSWIWAILFTTPCFFMGWFRFGHYESLCTYTFSGTGDKWKSAVISYSVITIITCIVVPFILLLFSYIRIFMAVHRQTNRVNIPMQQTSIRRASDTRRRTLWNSSVGYKGYRTIVLIVVLFLLSWAPFSVTRLTKIFLWNHEAVPAAVDTFATVFSFLSAAANPVAYGLFRKDFHRAFSKLFRQLLSFISLGKCGWKTSGEQAVSRVSAPISAGTSVRNKPNCS